MSMYIETKPHRSNRLFGTTAAVCMTALVGLAFATAVGGDLIIPKKTETIVSLLPNTTDTTEIEQPQIKLDDIEITVPENPVEVPLPPKFETIQPPPQPLPIEPPAPAPVPAPKPAPAPTPVVSHPLVRPTILPGDAPRYPSASIRAGEEGSTSLSVCIDNRGRVASARVESSSGFSRLDDAALKWVRKARFKPANRSGQPEAYCGHTVVYKWNLENAR